MGIKFFRKNYLDLDYSDVALTVTDLTATNDGADFLDLLRNRDNTSGWMTTNSSDAANTQLNIDLGQTKDFDNIILVSHNFRAYTIQYFDVGSGLWTNFSTAINPSANATATTSHSFTQVSARLIRLIVTATMVTNADKSLCQFIVSQLLGDLAVQPIIEPTIDKTRKSTKFLSGKMQVTRSVASFEVKLKQEALIADADQVILETLYDSFEGFLVWLCGGTVTQYRTLRKGYRLEDIFLMNVSTEYKPKFRDGFYQHGLSMDLSLVEIV